MAVSERQLAQFAAKHAGQIPYDTSPRHLAGPGDARHVTHGLAAAGWTCASDPLSPQIELVSPDRRYRLTFEPSYPASSWWMLSTEPFGPEPYWYAAFGELVPAEVIAATTDALLAPPPKQPPDVWQSVREAGWSIDTAGVGHSPDGLCHIELHRYEFHDTPDWYIETRKYRDDALMGPQIWSTRFRGSTPIHLVNAFVTALADSTPLQRGMGERTAHHSVVQEPSPLSPRQVVAAHTARLEVLRAQARAARRRQQLTTTPPSPVKAATPVRR